jgi:hypothetical protein
VTASLPVARTKPGYSRRQRVGHIEQRGHVLFPERHLSNTSSLRLRLDPAVRFVVIYTYSTLF